LKWQTLVLLAGATLFKKPWDFFEERRPSKENKKNKNKIGSCSSSCFSSSVNIQQLPLECYGLVDQIS